MVRIIEDPLYNAKPTKKLVASPLKIANTIAQDIKRAKDKETIEVQIEPTEGKPTRPYLLKTIAITSIITVSVVMGGVLLYHQLQNSGLSPQTE